MAAAAATAITLFFEVEGGSGRPRNKNSSFATSMIEFAARMIHALLQIDPLPFSKRRGHRRIAEFNRNNLLF
jgi:hypothetical protein